MKKAHDEVKGHRLKPCAVCGKEFTPAGARSTKCHECSKRYCVICIKEIPKNRTGVTCSGECAYEARALKAKTIVCAMLSCDNIFKPHNPKQKWCEEQHYSSCLSCGEKFEIKAESSPPELCEFHRKLAGNEARKAGQIKAFQAKYGVDNSFSLKDVQDKVKASNLKNYGVENQFQREAIVKKIKEDNLEKHGVEFSGQREEVKAKIRETNLERYGATTPALNEDVKAKITASMIERYGVENASQADEVKKKKKETSMRNYGVDHFMKSPDELEKWSESFEKTHHVAFPILLPHAVPGRISKPNKLWKEKLDAATGLDFILEHPVKSLRSVDLYIEHNNVKLAIEIHPTATHNAYKHMIACNRRGCATFPCKDHGKQQFYHADRTKALWEEGISLISIFDWMDEEKLINFIRGKLKLQQNKVGARQCEVRIITQAEANRFLKKYHLLGASRKQTYCYGLFFNDELLQVQTFAKRKADWEAKRLVSHPDWVVVGGISRLTKRFIKDANPEKIVAFTDLDLGFASFDSEFNGFQIEEIIKPQKCYSKGNRMVLAKSAAFQSADRLIGLANNSHESPYPANFTNEQVFLAEGWLPIYDCGMVKEVLHVKSTDKKKEPVDLPEE